MRLFYALPVPAGMGRLLGRACAELKRNCRGLSVPREEGMHFTLFFFGEVDGGGAAKLSRLLESAELERPAVRARFSAVETFPPEGNPRVIYAGLAEGADDIAGVYECLRRLLEKERWPIEDEHRPFRPHLTLARNKRDRIPRETLDRVILPREPFLIDRCVLYQSTLTPGGSVYHPLKERLFNT